ncbi:uncharacterized protein METZ01_LOCUS357239 [marine metagenome]|uniref:Uncharacterized protein n=1 Tax=marine metagenome TaxID=408172 RepID=A0A382S4H6_9ZZZZ
MKLAEEILEALFRRVQDLSASARFLFLKVVRRVGDNWLITTYSSKCPLSKFKTLTTPLKFY